jgi:prepilin-type N-terminal cleavage/methylation domain-containing protein
LRSAGRGFSLIEVLASLVLLGVGIVSVLAAFSSIASSEARSREVEKMHRLAMVKYDEMRAITDTFSGSESGDFTDQGQPDYVWELEVEPTGIENLDAVTITVEKRGQGGDRQPTATVTSLVFQQPEADAGGAL